ncbi:MAG: alkaline phosphatase family protein [Bacteroidetes bacterium]|nr:MAG: alkaline phosphatase family protein [Bacteroidota bacterium]
MIKRLMLMYLKLLLLWVAVFDFGRLLFLIHHASKFKEVNWSEILLAFWYSIRLDLATAAGLAFLPFVFYVVSILFRAKWSRRLFVGMLVLEFVFMALIHAGEINAYGEWNHKLTSRVFMHLSNPDEVFRSADYSMTFWFFVYVLIEVLFSWRIFKLLFRKDVEIQLFNWIQKTTIILVSTITVAFFSIVLLRGGFQAIPININSAIYSNHSTTNDLSINSLYFFSKSYLLYNRSEIDEFMPQMDSGKAEQLLTPFRDFPREHERYFLKNKRPNIVFVVMESWAAGAISCMSPTEGSTPHFDQLASTGLLFDSIFCTSHTSEIGNASIFAGFPSVPEVSISMQPEKSRKLRSLNQSLKKDNYFSSYLFSGDLKYGNIGGFFMDHGFDQVQDESDFPDGLKRGKLNYYDADLYDFFIQGIRKSPEPFMHCAFTGSTHSPFDVPKVPGQTWKGEEAAYMNSLVYADRCLGDFIEQVKKEKWYKNTLFIFVADHSHTTPTVNSPNAHAFYRIPLLFWGPVLEDSYRGKRISTVGSQFDIPATLLYQMGISSEDYVWSKDLMNPEVPQFAFHNIIGGYGWVRPKGYLIYQMQMKKYLEDTFLGADRQKERENCDAYMLKLYEYYKEL